ncbi:MAG: hypothetical protein BJ554DRAFT_1445, partial [Olpidium bornovanus]
MRNLYRRHACQAEIGFRLLRRDLGFGVIKLLLAARSPIADRRVPSACQVKEVGCIKTALQAKSINSARRVCTVYASDLPFDDHWLTCGHRDSSVPRCPRRRQYSLAYAHGGNSGVNHPGGHTGRKVWRWIPTATDLSAYRPRFQERRINVEGDYGVLSTFPVRGTVHMLLRKMRMELILQAESAPHATPIRDHASPSFNCNSPFLTGTSPGFAESSSKREDDLDQMLNVGKDANLAPEDLAQLPDQRIRSLETELHSRKRTLEALTARASAERAELVARHAADREAYDRIIRDAEVTIGNLRSQLESRSVRDSEPEGDGVTTNARIMELEALLCDKEAEIRNLTERLHLALNSRVPKLELEIVIQDRDSLAAELEETRALLDETKAYLEEMEQRETRILELEDKLQAKEMQISALEQERGRQDDRRLDLEKH